MFPRLKENRGAGVMDGTSQLFQRKRGNNRPMIVTGSKGRPKIYISRNQLEYFLEKGFKGSDIARILSVSNKTIYRRLQEFGLPVRASYSDISEAELDAIILDTLHNFPNCGYKSMRGHLL